MMIKSSLRSTLAFGAVPIIVSGLVGLLGACTATSGGSPQALVAPSPFLLQFVGEYDERSTGTGHLVLHVDGTFEATVGGSAVSGTFESSGAPREAGALLHDSSGHASSVTFATTSPTGSAPAQMTAVIAGALSAKLVAPWLAGGEAMCDATAGTWTDDDPDPTTGLYCRCAKSTVYLPSRGGCVEPASSGDPPRRGLSTASRAAAGSYSGDGRVAWVDLSADGTFRTSIDHQDDQGTWWDGTIPGQIELTSASHAFGGSHRDGSIRIELDGKAETLASSQ